MLSIYLYISISCYISSLVGEGYVGSDGMLSYTYRRAACASNRSSSACFQSYILSRSHVCTLFYLYLSIYLYIYISILYSLLLFLYCYCYSCYDFFFCLFTFVSYFSIYFYHILPLQVAKKEVQNVPILGMLYRYIVINPSNQSIKSTTK